MGKKSPPYVSKERTRHGRVNYYFRRDHGKRIRLPDLLDPGFDAAYMDALKGVEPAPRHRHADPRSLEWLIDNYRRSTAFTQLAKATQKQRTNIFKHVIATAGAAPYANITKAHIQEGMERRKATPAQAGVFKKTMNGLFAWAKDCGHVDANPTEGLVAPKLPNKDGFATWTDVDIERYQARWPVGTKERVWLDVLLYTGLRRGDAVQLGRQHVRDGWASIKTEKTDTEVTLPILPILQRTLDAGPTGDLHFIVGATGKPLTKESFGNLFRAACREAGVEKSAHGLRKAAATRAAERQATVSELEAMFGWSGGKMASLYTRKANRKRLGKSGWGKVK